VQGEVEAAELPVALGVNQNLLGTDVAVDHPRAAVAERERLGDL
jgi:hypothetical protein